MLRYTGNHSASRTLSANRSGNKKTNSKLGEHSKNILEKLLSLIKLCRGEKVAHKKSLSLAITPIDPKINQNSLNGKMKSKDSLIGSKKEQGVHKRAKSEHLKKNFIISGN
jgi:hypothetical protein